MVYKGGGRAWQLGVGKAGAGAFFQTAGKGKLAHHEHSTANSRKVEVHLTGLICENAQGGDLLGHPFCLGNSVATLHTEQHEQSGAYLTNDLAAYGDRGLGYPLDNGYHIGKQGKQGGG